MAKGDTRLRGEEWRRPSGASALINPPRSSRPHPLVLAQVQVLDLLRSRQREASSSTRMMSS